MEGELERNWNEGMALLRYYPKIFLEGLRKAMKNSVKIAGVPAEDQTEQLLNICLEIYFYANLFGAQVSLVQVL
jgi:hypothetical protein